MDDMTAINSIQNLKTASTHLSTKRDMPGIP